MLGQKLSGNGDILSFAYNSDEVVNGIGKDPADLSNPPGPTIAGVIDARDATTSPNILDGYIIQEGVIPEALAPLVQSMFEVPGQVRLGTVRYNALRQLLSSAKSRIFGPYAKDGSIKRTQTLLVMSHDNNEGILTLVGDAPYLEFVGVGKTEQVSRLRAVLGQASSAIGGTLVDVPSYAGKCSHDVLMRIIVTLLFAANA